MGVGAPSRVKEQKLQLPSLDSLFTDKHPSSIIWLINMTEKQVNYTLLSQEEENALVVRNNTRCNRRIWRWAVAGLLIVTAIFTIATSQRTNCEDDRFPISSQPSCPQYPPLNSLSDERRKLEKEVRDELNSDEFFDKSLRKLQGAVRIPTESFDDMGNVEEDPRWDIFKDFYAYLAEAFPLV